MYVTYIKNKSVKLVSGGPCNLYQGRNTVHTCFCHDSVPQVPPSFIYTQQKVKENVFEEL